MRDKRSKRGQMEILGLAVLFVIVIVGFLLFLRFGMDSAKTPVEEYYLNTLPQDMLDAIVHTSFDCDGVVYSVSDIIKDSQDDRYGGNIYCSSMGSEGSEDILDDIVSSVVAQSFEQLGRRYWVAVWDEDAQDDLGLISDDTQESFNYIKQSELNENPNCGILYPQEGYAKATYNLGTKTVFFGVGVCR